MHSNDALGGSQAAEHRSPAWCELGVNECHCGRGCGLFFTYALVFFSLLSYLMAVIVEPLSSNPSDPVVWVCAVVFAFLASGLVASLFRASFAHPGRVPEELLCANVEAVYQQLLAERVSNAQTAGSSGSAALTTGGTGAGQQQQHQQQQQQHQALPAPDVAEVLPPTPTFLRYCDRCDVYKLFDIHHCNSCEPGKCILRMDHHCPWIGNCVGRDNHKYFLLFLVYTSATGIFIVATSLQHVPVFGWGSKSTPWSVALMIACFLAGAFALVLMPFACVVIGDAASGTTKLGRMQAAGHRRPQSAFPLQPQPLFVPAPPPQQQQTLPPNDGGGGALLQPTPGGSAVVNVGAATRSGATAAAVAARAHQRRLDANGSVALALSSDSDVDYGSGDDADNGDRRARTNEATDGKPRPFLARIGVIFGDDPRVSKWRYLFPYAPRFLPLDVAAELDAAITDVLNRGHHRAGPGWR